MATVVGTAANPVLAAAPVPVAVVGPTVPVAVVSTTTPAAAVVATVPASTVQQQTKKVTQTATSEAVAYARKVPWWAWLVIALIVLLVAFTLWSAYVARKR